MGMNILEWNVTGTTTWAAADLFNTGGSDQSNSTPSFDETGYLHKHLGWRHRSRVESLTLTLVYCVVLVTGMIGNVATCAVIANNHCMHTATNYYLFSLAVSDALTLILGKNYFLCILIFGKNGFLCRLIFGKNYFDGIYLNHI